MNKSEFKVIIVGGSIAGLTLAHCLDRLGIEHIVLEKGSDPAPQLGASIGILPNGARVLDQLQLYSEVEQYTEPLNTATIRFADGFSFDSIYPKLIHQRFGYPITFLDRQRLLRILYDRYPVKERIRLSTKVTDIKTSEKNVTVTTASGTVYHGHLVVGADGVHSPVRSAMWAQADRENPGWFPRQERNGMTVEYSCVFGISSPIEGLVVGEQVNAFLKGATIVTIHGKNGRVYWFVIQKLDRKYTYPDAPRFNNTDVAPALYPLRDVRLMPAVTFQMVWESVVTYSMTALEENIFLRWHYARMVLIGDSAHKMTPNVGQGANMAIEDAATLTNLLKSQLDTAGHGKSSLPTNNDIHNLLSQYQTLRYDRVNSIYQSSRFLVRFQACDGLLKTIFARYYAPYAGDLPADMASKTIAGGNVCEFHPVPVRCGPGWAKYAARQSWCLPRVTWNLFCFIILAALTWFGRKSYLQRNLAGGCWNWP